jgi:hypothetical protein
MNAVNWTEHIWKFVRTIPVIIIQDLRPMEKLSAALCTNFSAGKLGW